MSKDKEAGFPTQGVHTAARKRNLLKLPEVGRKVMYLLEGHSGLSWNARTARLTRPHE